MLFDKRIKQLDDNVKNRQDIHAKKTLRATKEYYEQMLEKVTMYKQISRKLNRRKNKLANWKSFLDYCD